MNESNKAVVFRVGSEEYAFPIQYVISIEKWRVQHQFHICLNM